jgi:hypothetical protein
VWCGLVAAEVLFLVVSNKDLVVLFEPGGVTTPSNKKMPPHSPSISNGLLFPLLYVVVIFV